MGTIAQLIKLQDYTSRYQWDLNRYSKQYLKVKKEQWDKLNNRQEERSFSGKVVDKEETTSSPSVFSKIITKFRREKETDRFIEDVQSEIEDEEEIEIQLPEREIDLKRYFLNRMFPFQLRWASSTLAEKSFLHERYTDDPVLKYLLQRFPDNIFVMYEPIFELKNAPVESDTIIISPLGIEIIHFIEPKHPDAVIIAGNDRTWTINVKDEQEKILSPVISVKRTENVIRSILQKHDISFDLSKTILSRDHQIIHYMEPYKTNIIDHVNYHEWFQIRRNLSSPLKGIQLKAAETLLNYTQTTAVKRPEWNNQDDYPPLPSDT